MRKQQAAVPPIAPLKTNRSFRVDTVRDEGSKVKLVGDSARCGAFAALVNRLPAPTAPNSDTRHSMRACPAKLALTDYTSADSRLAAARCCLCR